jgi:formylglycine-generating enzyme required for sulfatase activity
MEQQLSEVPCRQPQQEESRQPEQQPGLPAGFFFFSSKTFRSLNRLSRVIYQNDQGIHYQPPERVAMFENSGVLIFEPMSEIKNFQYLYPNVNKDINMDFVLVQKGKFLMGSEDNDEEAFPDEKPSYEVEIVESFYMARYPCTQRLWQAVMGRNPSDYPCTQRLWQAVMGRNPSEFKGLDHPVEMVNWLEVQKFLEKLNQKYWASDSGAKGGFRLPTEAEWEYAARGGQHQAEFKYAGSSKLNEVGFYAENSNDHTWPVNAGKQANTLGIYGMSGNVWEWCDDIWDDNAYAKRNELGLYEDRWMDTSSDESSRRVVRGGSWSSSPQRCRVAIRNGRFPDDRFSNLGFRLVFSFSVQRSHDKPV